VLGPGDEASRLERAKTLAAGVETAGRILLEQVGVRWFARISCVSRVFLQSSASISGVRCRPHVATPPHEAVLLMRVDQFCWVPALVTRVCLSVKLRFAMHRTSHAVWVSCWQFNIGLDELVMATGASDDDDDDEEGGTTGDDASGSDGEGHGDADGYVPLDAVSAEDKARTRAEQRAYRARRANWKVTSPHPQGCRCVGVKARWCACCCALCFAFHRAP
jgi:hypothetical protein